MALPSHTLIQQYIPWLGQTGRSRKPLLLRKEKAAQSSLPEREELPNTRNDPNMEYPTGEWGRRALPSWTPDMPVYCHVCQCNTHSHPYSVHHDSALLADGTADYWMLGQASDQCCVGDKILLCGWQAVLGFLWNVLLKIGIIGKVQVLLEGLYRYDASWRGGLWYGSWCASISVASMQQLNRIAGNRKTTNSSYLFTPSLTCLGFPII